MKSDVLFFRSVTKSEILDEVIESFNNRENIELTVLSEIKDDSAFTSNIDYSIFFLTNTIDLDNLIFDIGFSIGKFGAHRTYILKKTKN